MSRSRPLTGSAPWWRRMFTVPNVLAVALGVTVFVVLLDVWDTNLGALAAAGLGATVTGLTWWTWWHLRPSDPIGSVLSSPHLGSIPDADLGPSPVLTAPDSEAAAAYRAAAARLESLTSGQVVLVASPSPGQGSTTVAMNLAMAAAKVGRRVVLIDGDMSSSGLSRFGSTGPAPGLAELASGDASLADASRLWALDGVTRLPVIPAGQATDLTTDALRGAALADAIDRITEKADLVVVDTAPILWNGASRPLATHADGTVLVVSPSADTETLAKTHELLENSGAPVMGYIVNRAATGVIRPVRRPAVRMLKRSLATFFIVSGLYAAWNAAQIWGSWAGVERNEFNVQSAGSLLPLPDTGISAADIDEETATAVTSPQQVEGRFLSFLVVGTDSRENLDPATREDFGDFEGARADVIILALLPNGPGQPTLVSIPRDLYLPNRCTQGYDRINAALEGCGDEVNGPELLALAVEDFTGVEVDHFSLFDFVGFERIIDQLGGIEICLEHAVRDRKALLELPAGCTQATGAQALAWVRSRNTQELVDGRWRIMPGVNDLARNERQQDLILELFVKLRTFSSPADLTNKVRSLTDAFTLDDQLGIGDAIGLAWSLRTIELDEINRVTIPVRDFVTSDGAAVLVPTISFEQLLADIYPETSRA